jgi:hypothetical protein
MDEQLPYVDFLRYHVVGVSISLSSDLRQPPHQICGVLDV